MAIIDNNRASTNTFDDSSIYVEPPFGDQADIPNEGAGGFPPMAPGNPIHPIDVPTVIELWG